MSLTSIEARHDLGLPGPGLDESARLWLPKASSKETPHMLYYKIHFIYIVYILMYKCNIYI